MTHSPENSISTLTVYLTAERDTAERASIDRLRAKFRRIVYVARDDAAARTLAPADPLVWAFRGDIDIPSAADNAYRFYLPPEAP